MNKRVLTLSFLVVFPVLALATGDHETAGEVSKYFVMTGREHDLMPRIFNFLIFAGILYYLIANPIKNFLSNRSDAIAKQLREIEDKMKTAEKNKKDAMSKLKDSEKKAKEIISDAKKEALVLSEKIMLTNTSELENLSKQFDEKTVSETRKSTKSTIDSILNENIDNNDISINDKQVISAISTKVVA